MTNHHAKYPETPAADHSCIAITDEIFSYRADGTPIIEDSDGSVDESEIDWNQALATTFSVPGPDDATEPTSQGDAQVLELQPSAPVTDPINELVQAMTPQDEEIVRQAKSRNKDVITKSATNGHWMYGNGRWYVPLSARARVIHSLHDSPTAGHRGQRSTIDLIVRNYWWPKLREQVVQYVASCDSCQRIRATNQPPPGLLNPLPLPDERFMDVTMDRAACHKTPEGYDEFTVITCRLTKYIRIFPTRRDMTAEELAHLFMVHWHNTGMGMPRTITSDRDRLFTSELWKALGVYMQCDLQMATARHQQTDGQSERAIRTIKEILRHFVRMQGTRAVPWTRLVSYAEFAINNARSTVTQFTPYELAFGAHPRTVIHNETQLQYRPNSIGRTQTNNATILSLSERLDTATQTAIARLAAYQDKMAEYADRHRSTGAPIHIGDEVLLLREGLSPDVLQGVDVKLLPRCLGPYTVQDVPDGHRLNYTLELPGSWRVHNTFHRDQLVLYVDPKAAFRTRMVEPRHRITSTYGNEEYEIEEVINTRIHRRKRQYLVRWKGYAAQHDSWVREDELDNAQQKVQDYLDATGIVVCTVVAVIGDDSDFDDADLDPHLAFTALMVPPYDPAALHENMGGGRPLLLSSGSREQL